jgi:hypothetical protein
MPVYFFKKYHSGGKSLQWQLMNYSCFLSIIQMGTGEKCKTLNTKRTTSNIKTFSILALSVKRSALSIKRSTFN